MHAHPWCMCACLCNALASKDHGSCLVCTHILKHAADVDFCYVRGLLLCELRVACRRSRNFQLSCSQMCAGLRSCPVQHCSAAMWRCLIDPTCVRLRRLICCIYSCCGGPRRWAPAAYIGFIDEPGLHLSATAVQHLQTTRFTHDATAHLLGTSVPAVK